MSDGLKLRELWRNIEEAQTAEEKQRLVDSLSEEEINGLLKESEIISPYSFPTIADEKEKYILFSRSNLRDEYMREFTMVTWVSFMYRMLKEYEDVNEGEKEVIKGFLDKYCEFNPDLHVRNTYKKNPDDLERKDLSTLDRELIPTMLPADTFHRWKVYTEAHYEELRESTEILSSIKPDIEDALIIYDVFDSIEECDSFKRKYQNDFKMDVLTCQKGKFTFLGPFAQNRERIDFYTSKNASILHQMLDKASEDQKLAADLMKKRTFNSKKKNLEEMGPHSDLLEKYKQTIQGLKSKDDLTEEQKEELIRTQEKLREKELELEVMECPDDAVQVNVFELSEDGEELKKSKFYSKSESIDESHSGQHPVQYALDNLNKRQ